MSDALSFLDGTDNGFEEMTQNEVTTPRLLISQPLSDLVQSNKVPVGHFYNSVTGEDYGTELQIIACHFQKVWVEWKPNNGGYVGTCKPGEIPVTGDPYTGMMHGENKVIETYAYLVVLPEHPDAGFMIFQSTPGNMKYLKGWNTQMRYLRTPAGKPAPLFAAVWKLTVNKDSSKDGKVFYSCHSDGRSSATFVDWVDEDTYISTIQPARNTAAAITARIDYTDEKNLIEAPAANGTEEPF